MRQFINKYKWIVIILCILVGIYFLWPIIADEGGEMPDNTVIGTVKSEQHDNDISKVDSNRSDTPIEGASIVYITGAIKTPGLYKVEQKATIGDAIKIAGGMLPYGDVESLNLAEEVSSGDHIHVQFNFKGNPETLLRPNKININTASVKELDTLPGIGPTTAKRIEEYRQTKGAFTTIEDIKQVKGIGDGLFKKIRDKITV